MSKTSQDALNKAAGEVENGSRDPNAKVRPARISMQGVQKLAVTGIELDTQNFYYRWFYENAQAPGRIAQAEAAYYERVTDGKKNAVTKNDKFGKMVLMRLPMEYRLADLAERKRAGEATMLREMAPKGNQYTPSKTSSDGGDTAFQGGEVMPAGNPFA